MGWISVQFARKLWAHTPSKVIIIADKDDCSHWQFSADNHQSACEQSILDAVGRNCVIKSIPLGTSFSPNNDEQFTDTSLSFEENDDEFMQCIFLWVTGKNEVKVLTPKGYLIVEKEDKIFECQSENLHPYNRVILGMNSSHWNPAEEFTDIVVETTRHSHPDLVYAAKEWRKSLFDVMKERNESLAELQAELASIGVKRKIQTLAGWLDLNRASPIAPKGIHTELAALWPLIKMKTLHSFTEVYQACIRLRALRSASSRVLLQYWKGEASITDTDEVIFKDIVAHLRQEVHVYEVEKITYGEVPVAMLGMWIQQDIAEKYETEASNRNLSEENEAEDTFET